MSETIDAWLAKNVMGWHEIPPQYGSSVNWRPTQNFMQAKLCADASRRQGRIESWSSGDGPEGSYARVTNTKHLSTRATLASIHTVHAPNQAEALADCLWRALGQPEDPGSAP